MERFKSAARAARENPKIQQNQRPKRFDDEKPRSERVKSARRSDEDRRPRHQSPAEEQKARSKSKSLRRDELVVENKIHEDAIGKSTVFGLSGELAAANTSKKAQQRLKKKLHKQQEEE